MTTQLLIYETAVPVSSGRHGKASIEAGKGYGFARKINSVPLTAVEFPLAAAEYVAVTRRVLVKECRLMHLAARSVVPRVASVSKTA